MKGMLSLQFLFDVLMNSLACSFSYNHFNTGSLLGLKKAPENKKHESSLVRQGTYYVISYTLLLLLTVWAILIFEEKTTTGQVFITDTYGEKHPVTSGLFYGIIFTSWISQLMAGLL